MKNIVALDCNSFALNAIQYIANDSESITCKLATKDRSVFIWTVTTHTDIDVALVHVHPKDYSVLGLIQMLLTKTNPPRVIIMLNYAHPPTLKLILSMGIRFILLRRDPISRIRDTLQQLECSYYISPELDKIMANMKPPHYRAVSWKIFSGVQNLTPVETSIFIDLLNGMTQSLAAKKRFVSIKTISVHKINAIKKIGVNNINEFFLQKTREKPPRPTTWG